MYRQESPKQLSFEDFYLPFGSHLNPSNRWVRLADLIPWDDFEQSYADQFAQSGQGAPAKPFRLALGSLIIKEKLNITDEEIVEQMRENHYLQYFVGMEGYKDEQLFDPSMMVHFRKRITAQMLEEINDRIHAERVKKNDKRIKKLKKIKKLS